MRALKTIIVICMALFLVSETHSSEETKQKQFEKFYEAKNVQKIKLQIIFDPLLDSLAFVVDNRSNAKIKIMPFTMGSNYLLIKRPDGKIIRIASLRRGQYSFDDLLPGKQKIMRIEKINTFIDFYIAPHKILGKYEILWCIDLFQTEKKTTYISNLLIIDFKSKKN